MSKHTTENIEERISQLYAAWNLAKTSEERLKIDKLILEAKSKKRALTNVNHH